MKFPGSSFHQGHISCRTRDANFCGFSRCNHTLLVQLIVSVWFQRLYHNLAGDRVDPNSLFHDLAVFWRNGELSVQIRSFSILLFALIVLLRVFIMTIIFFRCLSLNVNMHVHCTRGPTQTHLSGFFLQLFLCIVCLWGKCFCIATVTSTTLSVYWGILMYSGSWVIFS